MSMQLQALSDTVDAAIKKLNSPAPNAGFSQSDIDSAVAKARDVDAATQAQTDTANQAVIDDMAAKLAVAHSTAPGA